MVVKLRGSWMRWARSLSESTEKASPNTAAQFGEHRVSFCPECFRKQQLIDRLQTEIVSLKAKLRYQERRVTEGLFGSSTPSSKVPVKANTPVSGESKPVGGRPGHLGYGRQCVDLEQADDIQSVETQAVCPDCGCPLVDEGVRERTVIDCEHPRPRKTVYLLGRGRCPRCRRVFMAKAPGVLPKSLYSNNLLAHVAVQHYIHATPLGTLERQLGIGHGGLLGALHLLAERLHPVLDHLVEEYRNASVKHADETGWRTAGKNGYVWDFCTSQLSLFRFRGTRSALVPREVFGAQPLPGHLVVDRYNGYNKSPVQIQYCYSHLLREVKDLRENFPDQPEVDAFVNRLAPLLADAMQARIKYPERSRFLPHARAIKKHIVQAVGHSARHPGIQAIQNIFRDNPDRMYHWAEHPDIPAENNFAERDLRRLVITRKTSFGSVTDKGARTREILSSILYTLAKRTNDPFSRFKSTLDQLAQNPNIDIYNCLFQNDSS